MYRSFNRNNAFRHGDLIADLGNIDVTVIFQVIIQTGCKRYTVISLDKDLSVALGKVIIVISICSICKFKCKPVFISCTDSSFNNSLYFIDRILIGNSYVVCRVFKIFNLYCRSLLNSCTTWSSKHTDLVDQCFGGFRLIFHIDTYDSCFFFICLIRFPLSRAVFFVRLFG